MLDRLMEAYKQYTEKHRWLGMRPQMAMSVGLFGLAAGLAIGIPTPIRILCAVGMLLSLLGDFLLSPDSSLRKGHYGDPLWYGGSAFALAHVCYAVGFWLKATEAGAFPLYALAVGLPALFGGWFLYIRSHRANPTGNLPLLVGALLYWMLICLNVTAVCGALLANPSLGAAVAVAGILSFAVSDAILLCGAVGPRTIPYYDQWIWVFYPIGQLLLILGA